jgi:hypothetical protein
MTVLSGFPLIGSAALFAFFSLGMQPIENSLFAHYTPRRWRATAYGFKFVLTFGVGSLAVWLVQWADTVSGLSFALLCLAGVVALIIGAAAVLVSLGERRAVATPGGRRSVSAGGGGVLVANTAPTERRPPGVVTP